MTDALELALSSADGKFAYRFTDGIVELLEHRGIWLAGRPTSESENLRLAAEKEDVQGFHDDLGWQQADDGLYNDTAKYTGLREVPAHALDTSHKGGEAVPSRTGTVPP